MFKNLEFETKINKTMSKIKGSDLIKLGFKKEHNTPVVDDEEKFYYFVYEVNKHCLLISSDNLDSDSEGGYWVEFYEIPDIRFTELEDLKELVKLLKKASA
jgi:hypothetical protein